MTSNYHSRILRESMRDGNNSVASSTGSRHGTVSPDSTFSNTSFAPDQDDPYSESTKMFEDQSAPKIRDTAKKYKYPWARSQSPEMLINTSALRKSFPNFSQASSPRDRIDIEKIARLAAQSRNRDPTPTRPAKPETTNQQKPSTPLAKEQNRRVPAQQKENVTPASYVSGATKTRDGAIRRTLADLHPKVRDESDYSFVSDRLEKSSRFSNNDYTQQSENTTTNTQPPKPQVATKTARTTSQKSAGNKSATHRSTPYKPKSQENFTITSSVARNPTQQSFLLPKGAPEISELVTATFKDGSPVYVQSGAVQSRFSSTAKPLPRKHIPVDAIEVPQDEQDIFLSLETMQERITQLEGEKSDVQRIANDLDKENYKLQEDLKHALGGRRRSDSAIADTGVDAEKSKLQDEVNNLKIEAEASKRKIQTLELHLTNNTTERDRAISRVAEFNKTCESLKSENIGLRNEVDALRQQGEHIASQREASYDELHQNEASWKGLQAELEHQIHVQEDKALGYERYISDIRKSYTELQERQRASSDEIASLKHQLQTSNDLYSTFLQKYQENGSTSDRKDEDSKKIYRLEKALRKVMSLKYETYLIMMQRDGGNIISTPPFFTEGAPKSTQKSNAGSVFQGSAFSKVQAEDTAKTPTNVQQKQNQRTTTPFQATSPMKGNVSPQKIRMDILTEKSGVDATFSKSTPFSGGKFKLTSGSRIGPKTALTNAAIKAYGYEDFPWEFEHNDDLTRSTNFDSIVGEGVMQELRDDVVNARQMQSNNPITTDINLTSQSKQGTTQHVYTQDEDDVFNTNTRAKTPNTLQKGSVQQPSTQSNDPSDLNIQKNPSRLTSSPKKTRSFNDFLETPLENIQQRCQQRRRSEGSLELTGEVNHTINTSVSEKSTVLHTRSRSQTSGIGRSSRVSNHRRSNSDNMTSAYIIPDIDVPASAAENPRRLSNASLCKHGLTYYGPSQCGRCVHAASFIVETQESCHDATDVIPVSERMPAATDSQDQATLRPSMPPLNALEKVVRSLLEEERSIRKQLAAVQSDLNSHDSSLARTKRQAMAAQVTMLHKASQEKAEQIYFLYDVLEGLKENEEWEGCQD